MKSVISASVLVLLVVGCSDSVPNVQDPHNIVIAGESITQQAFLEKYCAGKTQHETCNKVYRAMIADSTHSKRGVGRF
jgi:hypothetical protein